MNLEIANRLQQLRKEKGLSQEDLAEKIGVSRQAVSKWERAEASPDTDNLIALAELYNVSLDTLVKGVPSQEKTEEKPESVTDTIRIDAHGVHLYDDEGKVLHIGKAPETDDEEHDVDYDDVQEVYYDHGKKVMLDKDGKPVNVKKKKLVEALDCAFSACIVMAYLALGFAGGWWHPSWILFLLIPVFSSLCEAIAYKDYKKFAFPILVLAVYLLLGCVWGLWTIGLVCFVAIFIHGVIIKILDSNK